MPDLTRRRDRTRREECWDVFYGDVHVGSIGRRAGVPYNVDQWGWSCGFYPGSEPGEHRTGSAATIEEARRDFGAAWAIFLSRRTEADFQAWRHDRDWHTRKYAMWERGEKMPTQFPSSLMRCACGTTFDSHKLEENLIHCPHIYAAQAADGIRR